MESLNRIRIPVMAWVQESARLAQCPGGVSRRSSALRCSGCESGRTGGPVVGFTPSPKPNPHPNVNNRRIVYLP